MAVMTTAGRVLLASPRSFCAGVERAIQIVERALEIFGPPVYVRKEIVHNSHVVADLEARGAIFVDSESDVPPGGVCVFSAHGVSPAVRRNAAARRLRVIDATCPLVNRVHVEAKALDRSGRRIILIGHEGHEEIEGTAGEAPDRTLVIERPDQIEELDIPRDEPVGYLTQTTLSVDDTQAVVEALRARFTDVKGPEMDNICYASQNRQKAVKAIAPWSDLVLIVGAVNSSNSNRLVEVARKCGTLANLVPDESHLDVKWLEGVETIGVASGASAPEVLVARLLRSLADLGYRDVVTRETGTEDVSFSVPAWLRAGV